MDGGFVSAVPTAETSGKFVVFVQEGVAYDLKGKDGDLDLDGSKLPSLKMTDG